MIILASESPRRKELLDSLGLSFEVMATNVNENVDELLSPSEYVSIISKRKAISAVETCSCNNLKQVTIITADTVVCIGDKILGKPKDREDALFMLRSLENNWHCVYTGICVAFMNNDHVEYVQDCCQTKVKFKHLTEQQIEAYIDTDEPYDKAGSYAIQGIGREFVDEIDGDYNNVVGLPVEKLISILNDSKYAGGSI